MKLKAPIVYAAAIALVFASWAGNYAYYRSSQLPEAGFLRHYIESSYVPSVAFDLLYVANKTDKRKVINVQVEELPALKFYPAIPQRELSHQTIYLLRGEYKESLVQSRQAMEPLKLHTVTVYYNDGTVVEEDIGEIIVYRDEWPLAEEDRPIEMSGVGGSSDGSGWATVRTTSPVTITGVSSAWVEKLGTYFEYKVKPGGAQSETITFPWELDSNGSLKLDYKFMIPNESKQAMEVYSLLLNENYEDKTGRRYNYPVFAQYQPSPSESTMRTYVRDKRREAR